MGDLEVVIRQAADGAEEYVPVIYGSYATGEQHNQSDIDITVVTTTFSQDLFEVLDSALEMFFCKYGICKDDEVPRRNKLLVTRRDLATAAELSFLPQCANRLIVPSLIKDPDYLASEEVKYRLLFNILTTPTLVICRDVCGREKYKTYQQVAACHLRRLASDLAYQYKCELREALLQDDKGREGEMHLGYKRHSSVLQYLDNLLYA